MNNDTEEKKRMASMRERMIFELKDAASFYNLKNRGTKTEVTPSGTTKKSCVYHPTEHSPGCAIGRKMNEEEQERMGNFIGSVDSLIYENGRPKYWECFHSDFLMRLQDLHDTEEYWTDEGISEKGKSRVDEIIYGINSGFWY